METVGAGLPPGVEVEKKVVEETVVSDELINSDSMDGEAMPKIVGFAFIIPCGYIAAGKIINLRFLEIINFEP